MERVSPLIRTFIIFLSRKLSSGETKATERKLKTPLLFVLDEFDKLGKYDELHKNMGIHNGFGIHYFLIIQSINQINEIYGKDNSFLSHCRNTVMYAPGDYEAAKLCSEIFGKESVWKANTSNSGSRFSIALDNISVSGQEAERALANPENIMRMPKDELILLSQGMAPYIGKKCVYYEDYRYTKRLVDTAFSTREEAIKIMETNENYANKKEAAGRPKWFENFAVVMAHDDKNRMIDPSKITWKKKTDDGGDADSFAQNEDEDFDNEDYEDHDEPVGI
jgi:type IV secretion system protein VirD4